MARSRNERRARVGGAWDCDTAEASRGTICWSNSMVGLPRTVCTSGEGAMATKMIEVADFTGALKMRASSMVAQLGARADARSSVSSAAGVPSRAAQLLRWALQ